MLSSRRPRRRDQRDGERDLGHDHRAEHASRRAALQSAPSAFVHAFGQVRLVAVEAGARPTSTPATIMRAENTKHAQIELHAVGARQRRAADEHDARTAAAASGSATTVAATAMSNDSATTGRTVPSRRAQRRAHRVSRARVVPRASSRFATFTIASTNSSPVAANAMQQSGRVADDRVEQRTHHEDAVLA